MIKGQIICSILLAFSVSASKQENQNEQWLVRGRQNFNHPPNFENYNPLLVIEESDGDVQTIKILKNGVISTRSLKNIVPEDEPTEGDLFERTSIKPINKGKSFRINQVSNLKSKTNEKNTLVTQNLPKHVSTESVTKKPILAVSTDEEKVKIINTEGQSTKKNPKRSHERKPVIPIIENENFVYSHTGDFHYSYESGDGTKAFEKGVLKTFEDKTAGEAVVGSFSYTDKDGNDFSLSYTADENGYRPEGAHLPTPPPIPPAIARALLYLSTKTTPQPATESYL